MQMEGSFKKVGKIIHVCALSRKTGMSSVSRGGVNR